MAKIQEEDVDYSHLTTELKLPSAFQMFMNIAQIQAKQSVRRSLRAMGINCPEELKLDDLAPPATAAVKRATDICREVSSDALFNHCMRAYYFAVAIFHHQNILNQVDLEAAYVAMAFHDYGLTEIGRSDKEQLQRESFEVRGAKACYKCCLQLLDYDKEDATLLYEAIRLHSTMGIAEKGSVIGKFVNFGSVCDVIGYHIEDVHERTKDTIISAYPRLEWKRFVISAFKQELQMSVSPIMKFTIDHLFFERYVRSSPFAE